MSEVSSDHKGTEQREQPLGEVARNLTRDLSLLVRQEVELAKSEMAKKGRVAAPGLGTIGGAGVVGLMAAGALSVPDPGAVDPRGERAHGRDVRPSR